METQEIWILSGPKGYVRTIGPTKTYTYLTKESHFFNSREEAESYVYRETDEIPIKIRLIM